MELAGGLVAGSGLVAAVELGWIGLGGFRAALLAVNPLLLDRR